MPNDPLLTEVRRIAEYLGCNEGELVSEMRLLIDQARKEGVLKHSKVLECLHKNTFGEEGSSVSWCRDCGQAILK